MKMKECWPPGGGARVPGTPLRSATENRCNDRKTGIQIVKEKIMSLNQL